MLMVDDIEERKTTRGVERHVFSSWLALPALPPPTDAPDEPVSMPEAPALGGPVIDAVEEFTIHVPPTNVRPIKIMV